MSVFCSVTNCVVTISASATPAYAVAIAAKRNDLRMTHSLLWMMILRIMEVNAAPGLLIRTEIASFNNDGARAQPDRLLCAGKSGTNSHLARYAIRHSNLRALQCTNKSFSRP